MKRLIFLIVILTTFTFIAVACGGAAKKDTLTLGDKEIVPIPGNSELVVGPNRFALALLDKDNNPILESGNSVHMRFFDPDGALQSEEDARFVWAIQDETGFWAADVNFNKAGTWKTEAVLSRSGDEKTVTFTFTVLEHGVAPAIGDPAPAADNLTLATDPGMKRLTTDPQPDQAFYQMTITQALAARQPFVVVFATPLFCQTQFCGPILNNVKAVQPDFAGQVNFIHIEPFELDENGRLVTDAEGAPIAAQPTNDWHLQTEPWIFIVGADGKIAARFEGAASTGEIRGAVRQTLGG